VWRDTNKLRGSSERNEFVYWSLTFTLASTIIITQKDSRSRVQFFFLPRLTDWLTDWLTGWLTDWLISVLPNTPEYWLLSQSQSHIATDGHSVSKPCCRVPSGAHDQIFITVWQLQSSFCGAPSLTRGRVSLLAYAAGPCQRSLSRVWVPWTGDNSLLSQIWHLPYWLLSQVKVKVKVKVTLDRTGGKHSLLHCCVTPCLQTRCLTTLPRVVHGCVASRMVELYLHSPIRLHGVVLNELSMETTLYFTLPMYVR
jgi:hypothetical protein